MRQTAKYDHPTVVLRPFLWIAATMFAGGYYGYLALVH